MESKNQIRQRGQQLLSRYVDSASRIHISDSKQPLRWTAAVKSQAVPLLVKKWKVLKAPFGTGVDTHTHTLEKVAPWSLSSGYSR